MREYSAVMITAFTLITGTPASIGLLVGGRFADSRGRRLLSAITFPMGAILLTGAFSTSGQAMWLASLSGGICLGLAYPAMAVYRGEMFPTLHRSFASGVIMTSSLIGGSVGLVGAWYFESRHQLWHRDELACNWACHCRNFGLYDFSRISASRT